ncbi:MAG: hypothetical protein LBG88_04095 [Christensenellaceae bacterium]|jgi:hypothetical protein|nr:hypothetical protein [Christensenellaceae bacterium]
MKNNKVFVSTVAFIGSIVFALIGYVVIFSKFDRIIGEFTPMFCLCVITFVAGLGIVLGAALREQVAKEIAQDSNMLN